MKNMRMERLSLGMRYFPRTVLVTLFLTLCLPVFCATKAVEKEASAHFDFNSDRPPIASLDGIWRFHPGDDPDGRLGWAQADFDDSAWALLRSDRPWNAQGYWSLSGYAWYRFTVTVPDGSQPLALELPPIATACEVYVDGARVGSAGSIAPRFIALSEINFYVSKYPLPTVAVDSGSAPSPRTYQIAVRVWHSRVAADYYAGGPQQAGARIGLENLIGQDFQRQQDSANMVYVDAFSFAILAGVIGINILGLSFFRRKEREYLWFSLIPLSLGADAALSIYMVRIWHMVPLWDLVDGTLIAISQIAMVLFLRCVLDLPKSTAWKLLLLLAALSPLGVPLYWAEWVSVPISSLIEVGLILPAALWLLWTLVIGSLRGDTTARLLLAPVFLVEGLYVADNVVLSLWQLGFKVNPYFFEYPFFVANIHIHAYILARILFLLAMLGFLIFRFTGARRREDRMISSLEATRQVQRILLPEALPQIPGFTLDCVYRPAEMVGGDFFQALPTEHDGLLLILGDVSGKGLPASMVVAMLVGAARAQAAIATDPASLLAGLNRCMMGNRSASCATCLVCLIAADGSMTVASAGHPAPYRNGAEIELPGALPLGITSGAEYENRTVALAAGDRLVFLSDGIAEARDASGHLLGFDGVSPLLDQSADAIAHAAQAFGQEDDITVLTLRWNSQVHA